MDLSLRDAQAGAELGDEPVLLAGLLPSPSLDKAGLAEEGVGLCGGDVTVNEPLLGEGGEDLAEGDGAGLLGAGRGVLPLGDGRPRVRLGGWCGGLGP